MRAPGYERARAKIEGGEGKGEGREKPPAEKLGLSQVNGLRLTGDKFSSRRFFSRLPPPLPA